MFTGSLATFITNRFRPQHHHTAVASVDPATAMARTLESLEKAGWARHRVLRPGLGYWVCNPTGIWLVTLAAFGGPCPPFLAPLATSGAWKTAARARPRAGWC